MSIEKRKNKWAARIQIDGKRVYLGTFELKRDAIAAYDYAKRVVQSEKEFQKAFNEAATVLYQGDEVLAPVHVSFWTKFKNLFR